MAAVRGSILILDSGHVATVIGTVSQGVLLVKDETEEGETEELAQADADAQQAVAQAAPAGAPAVGSEVFITQSSQAADSTGSQIWFVLGYFNTADVAAVKGLLQSASDPLKKCAVVAAQLVAFPAHA